MYETGYDFFRDLLQGYGKQQAVSIANNYLDTQAHVYGCGSDFFRINPEEFRFCCELYQATIDCKEMEA